LIPAKNPSSMDKNKRKIGFKEVLKAKEIGG
jgi:hypothetical protein